MATSRPILMSLYDNVQSFPTVWERSFEEEMPSEDKRYHLNHGHIHNFIIALPLHYTMQKSSVMQLMYMVDLRTRRQNWSQSMHPSVIPYFSVQFISRMHI